ncbi:MAG: DUF2490 domain-containing protein [Candidatus Firestonebacteria bacterium]
MKKLLVIVFFCLGVSGSLFSADTGRIWESLNITALLSPELSFTVIPGHRWEFAKDLGYTSDSYYHDLYIGPTYTTKIDEFLKLKFSLWYYYMGFPNRFTESYPFTHSIEVIPAIDWKISDKLTISDRLIFHNTFFSSSYATSAQQNGLSMMVREMITFTYSLSEVASNLKLTLADEVFIGLLEDSETAPSSTGFYRNGFNANRLYIGFSYSVDPTLNIAPQYIYETAYNSAGTLTSNNHNFNLSVTYQLKLF